MILRYRIFEIGGANGTIYVHFIITQNWFGQ